MAEPRYLTLADNLELMRPNAHGRFILALEKSQRTEVVEALRLAAKPADDEHLSIIVGVKNVLEFAIGLAWDAERLIPDSEPRRLRNMLNNIRQGYLKPAVERLNAASPSATGEPKR